MYNILPRIAGRLLPGVVSKCRDNNVYLSFDDGPDPIVTPRVLNILDKENVRATFFLTGKQVEQFPIIVRSIADNGHTIGNHGYDHKPLAPARWVSIMEEIRHADDVISNITGVTPGLFRPPYGHINISLLKATRKMQKTIVLWTYSPADWQPLNPEILVRRITKNVASGSITLLHDRGHGAQNMLAALPDIIRGIRSKGFDLMALPEKI